MPGVLSAMVCGLTWRNHSLRSDVKRPTLTGAVNGCSNAYGVRYTPSASSSVPSAAACAKGHRSDEGVTNVMPQRLTMVCQTPRALYESDRLDAHYHAHRIIHPLHAHQRAILCAPLPCISEILTSACQALSPTSV